MKEDLDKIFQEMQAKYADEMDLLLPGQKIHQFGEDGKLMEVAVAVEQDGGLVLEPVSKVEESPVELEVMPAKEHISTHKEPKRKARLGRPPTIKTEATKADRIKPLIVQLPSSIHAAFKEYCEARELSMSGHARAWVEGIVASHSNTAKELRQEKFNAWVEKHKNIAGFSLQKALDRFRSIEAEIEESEKAGEQSLETAIGGIMYGS